MDGSYTAVHRAAKARAVPAPPAHTRNPETDTSIHPPKKPPHTSTQAISEERESEDRGTAEQGATGGATGAAEGGVDLSAGGGGGRDAEADPAAHPGGTLAPSGPLLAQRTRIPTLRRVPDAHRLSFEPAGSPQQPAHGTGNREAAARDRNRRAARGGSGDGRGRGGNCEESGSGSGERSDGRELEHQQGREGGAQAKAGGPNPLWARARRQAVRAQRQRFAVTER